MAQRHLTKKGVDSLPPASRPRGENYYDTDLRGFGITVYPSGHKVFFVEYGRKGHRRRMTLEAYGVLDPKEARKQAKAALAAVAAGEDPLEARAGRRAVPLFAEWAKEYVAAAKLRKKDSRADQMYLLGSPGGQGHKPKTSEALRRWGSKPLDTLTTADIEALVQDIAKKGHSTSANRLLASISACLQAAWRAGRIPNNPDMRVRGFRENEPRARVLSDDELARFNVQLEKYEDPMVRLAFRMLLDTGARKSEVLRARWEDFDLEAKTWRIPSPKAGHPQVVYLADSTVAYLRNAPQRGPWLVPGADPQHHRADLFDAWKHLKELAELGDDVRVHDLRRTFGLRISRLAGLHVAQQALRQSDIRVTQRVYAPLGGETVRDGVEQAVKQMGRVLPMRPAAKRKEG